ncbi:MAG: PepSY domain-containing protein [Prevotellaceae bacterium]|jgi:uncharacterized iron-regulated membrane protein|nr:PepSY domain-containing protein [Prevotellaceae bacterium]
MKKIIRKIHLWISFPIGLIITIMCLTGAVLVFRTEIEETLFPERFFVKEINGEPMTLDRLIPLINSQLENNSVTGVSIPNNPKRNYMMSLAEGSRVTAYANPYTGKLVEISQFSNNFFAKIMQLHRWLLNTKIGKPITGYSTLLFAIILITGIIIVIPKNRKGVKQLYTINVNKGWKRFWYDMHTSAGTLTCMILLVLALTGLTWSFSWYNVGVYKLFGAELPAMNHNQHNRGNQQQTHGNQQTDRNKHSDRGQQTDRGETKTQSIDFTHWQDILEKIKGQNADYKTIAIQNESVTVSQKRIWGNARAADKYTFDAKTGEITNYQPYAKADKSTKIRGWLYTLHVGAWGGLFSKIITFIAALVGASLPLTGYYIFYKKRKRRKK